MPKDDVETYHEAEQWHSRVEGESDPFMSAATKDEAVEAGRKRARADSVEHLIKDMDGQIGERNTYGNDPREIPG